MKVIRKYLLADAQISALLDNKPSVYLLQKPQEIKDENYIVYLYKVLNGGYIKDYQLEFRLIGKDLGKLTAIQSRLIGLLDNPKGQTIKDEETIIRHTKLLNGGGMIFNQATGNYELVVFFLCKV